MLCNVLVTSRTRLNEPSLLHRALAQLSTDECSEICPFTRKPIAIGDDTRAGGSTAVGSATVPRKRVSDSGQG